MRIPQIQLTITDIQMNTNVTDAKQHIQQPHATQHIEQSAAKLEIHTKDAKVLIDNSQLWRDLGLKPTGELISEYAEKGRQANLKAIAQKMSEGSQLRETAGKGQNAVQQMAVQKFGPKPTNNINIKFIPSYNAVKINVQPGDVDIRITPQDVKIDVKVNKPIINYTPGEISGTMIVRPDVQTDVIG